MQAIRSNFITNKELKAYAFLKSKIINSNYSSINILCDTNTKKLCLSTLLDELKDLNYQFNIIEIPHG